MNLTWSKKENYYYNNYRILYWEDVGKNNKNSVTYTRFKYNSR